jgi:hypothetical protein
MAPQAMTSEGAGEVIGSYHTYHSNGVCAQIINPDLGLSLDSDKVANATNVKHFVRGPKSMICFLDQ